MRNPCSRLRLNSKLGIILRSRNRRRCPIPLSSTSTNKNNNNNASYRCQIIANSFSNSTRAHRAVSVAHSNSS